MNSPRIRPIAICLFRDGSRILISEDFDSVKQDWFCRPLGGGIEHGETSQDAVLREIREEIGAEIQNLRLVGVLENIFVCEGQQGHEIVFVYDAEFTDKSLYGQEEIGGYEQEVDVHFKAKWLDLSSQQEGDVRLVPEGLLQLIADDAAHEQGCGGRHP